MRGRKGGGVGAKGKGDLRRGEADEERKGDEGERKVEKVDEREERSEAGVCGVALLLVTWNSLPPPSIALEPPCRSSALSSPSPHPPVRQWFQSRVTPPIEAPTVHPRAAN